MKNKIFTLIMIIGVISVVGSAYYFIRNYMNRGLDLNKMAWESSYRERNLPVPESGPREGYWGARTGKEVRDERSGWRENEIHIPGLVEVDALGLQYFRSSAEIRHRVIIVGGSVAYGAYASKISTTYFNIIGVELERRSLPVEIIIISSGAWKSVQEVHALEFHLQRLQPDLVVFLDGLNDLTSGSTYQALFAEETPTHDGSPWHVLYHAHDYALRVSYYLKNMTIAREMTAVRGIDMLVVLQPSLNERTRRTEIEDRILSMSLLPHASSNALSESYSSIRKSMTDLARSSNFSFLDCSKVLDAEKETVFTDIWHFTDFGHRVLGGVMAEKIAEILNRRTVNGTNTRLDQSVREKGL
jgi:hypothetical protein